MRGESYTIQEVAELLGVSKRTLQRRLREGAFPGRFLAPGPHGLETRIPAHDVRRVLSGSEDADEERSMVSRSAPLATSTSAALAPSDLEAVRDAVIAITRADREAMLGAVRDALVARDRELMALRGQVGALQSALDRLRLSIEGWREEHAVQHREEEAPVVRDAGASVLQEIEEMLSQLSERH